jgi:hypothetical protein
MSRQTRAAPMPPERRRALEARINAVESQLAASKGERVVAQAIREGRAADFEAAASQRAEGNTFSRVRAVRAVLAEVAPSRSSAHCKRSASFRLPRRAARCRGTASAGFRRGTTKRLGGTRQRGVASLRRLLTGGLLVRVQPGELQDPGESAVSFLKRTFPSFECVPRRPIVCWP